MTIKSAKFKAKPVLLIDLPRSASSTTKTLYQTLETIQGSFSGSDGTVTWQTPPHVLVFANDTPKTDCLSADRLRVFLVTQELELVQPKYIEAQLKANDEIQNELQAQEEKAALTGVAPQRLLTRLTSGAAGGAGGSGTLSPEAKATVVAELKSLIEPKEESVVTLRTNEPSLVHALSPAIMLLLDAKSVVQARNPKASVKWGTAFLANLKSCLADADGAFPGYRIEKNTTGAEICGRTDRFTGDYILGLTTALLSREL